MLRVTSTLNKLISVPIFQKRLPFGVHSVFVYYAVALLEYGIWYFIVVIFFCSIGFLVTLCKMVSMFLEDLTADWRHLDRINKTGVQRKFKMKLHGLIDSHSQIIQLSSTLTSQFNSFTNSMYAYSFSVDLYFK